MGGVTASLNELAAAVSAIHLAGTGLKIVEAVGAKVIEMEAGNDIRKAVEHASEAVDVIAPALVDNFADLRSSSGETTSARRPGPPRPTRPRCESTTSPSWPSGSGSSTS